MAKSYAEINEKIKKGEAVVVTAEELVGIAREKDTKKAAEEIDVVTTATFGSMCSSGAFLNTGHTSPRIKFGGGEVTLNDVTCYAGLAAVDLYIGATATRKNSFEGGRLDFDYGGGHVIHDLVAGKDIHLKASAYGTNCYPRKELDTWINIKDINQAILVNPRNAYQNYNIAVNKSAKTIYTYMGKLLPNLGNATYSSAGQLSPLLKDPLFRTIGIGTRAWIAGAQGYIFGQGTQHNPSVPRKENDVPSGGAGTIAVTGDLKEMNPEYLVGTSFTGYGSSLAVGLGIPIPVLDEDTLKHAAVSDEEIFAPVVDYSSDYPNRINAKLGEASYAQLRSGTIELNGKEIPTGSLSSYAKAREIAEKLKKEVQKGKFLLQEPIQKLPLDAKFKALEIRQKEATK